MEGMARRTFLTAEWRNLILLNYAIDPEILKPRLPHGTELDFLDGVTFVSVVGFHFLRTRVLGVPVPFHRDFEEVNLRFYVRRKSPEGWRRGVVFVRELVPKYAIAFIAQTLYGEPYHALPMKHRIERTSAGIDVEYEWRNLGRWEKVWARGAGEPRAMGVGSAEEFIAEHYWGYTARSKGCSEYEVVHPPWKVWPATDCGIDIDVPRLYGEQFRECLAAKPASAFIAEGSPVSVRMHSWL